MSLSVDKTCPHGFSGIKKYVVGLIIKTSSDAANVEVSVVLPSRVEMDEGRR